MLGASRVADVRPHHRCRSSIEGILAGVVLSFAHTLGEFGVVLMVGGNLPGVTRTISICDLRRGAGLQLRGRQPDGARCCCVLLPRARASVYAPAAPAVVGRAASMSTRSTVIAIRKRLSAAFTLDVDVRRAAGHHDPLRRVRLRQDHAAAAVAGLIEPDAGRIAIGERRAVRLGGGRATCPPAAADRLRVSAPRAVPAPDGRGEHRVRPRAPARRISGARERMRDRRVLPHRAPAVATAARPSPAANGSASRWRDRS